MLLVDANLLIYAYQSNTVHHARARAWLESVLNGDEDVLISMTTLLAFMRIMTDPGLHANPLDVPTVHRHVTTWLARPNVSVAEPTPEHWSTILSVATEGQARGPVLMDAHLAALAIEHGATVCTADRDLRRFKGIRIVDPIKEPHRPSGRVPAGARRRPRSGRPRPSSGSEER